jgi:DNA-directed RNA polymerase subunit RPC12/RpoP
MFEDIFTCEKCNRIFVSEKLLQIHQKAHDKDFLNHFCELCGDLFLTLSGLMRHLDYDHPSGDKEKFKCQNCTRSFKIMINLDVHNVAEHKKIDEEENEEKVNINPECEKASTNFTCSFCGKKFNLRRSYSLHVDRYHQKSTKRRFKCPICPQSFRLKENLRIHLRGEHRQLALTSYKCEICHQKFAYLCGFSRHLKQTHPEEVNRRKMWTNKFYEIQWRSRKSSK